VRAQDSIVTLGSTDANLPASYEAARRAIIECLHIDEAKEWADKAQALSSYARMANDEALLVCAQRIKARAIRRMGELLKEIPDGNLNTRFGSERNLSAMTRAKAAFDAGLSDKRRKTAIRLASIQEEVFEQAIEVRSPPPIVTLAAMGTTPRPKQKMASIAYTETVEVLAKAAKFADQNNARELAQMMSLPEARSLRRYVDKLREWSVDLAKHLPGPIQRTGS
jgi:hypothetical protein